MRFSFIFAVVLILTSCSAEREKIETLDQLSDKKICVLTGSAGDLAARERFPDAEIMGLTTSADAAYNVKIGKTDAFVFNRQVLNNVVQQNDDLKILDEPVSRVDVAIAFNKDNTELANEFNQALSELKQQDVLGEMRSKWFSDFGGNIPKLPEVEVSDPEKTLKIGVSSVNEPFMFMANNELTGFDMELIVYLSEILNVKTEFVDMNFEALIPALQSNKIDLAISNFNITEERKDFVLFSDPYLVQENAALVKK